MSRPKGGTIGVRAFRKKCADDARSVLNRGLASERELEELRPGGVRNPDETVNGWLHYHTCIHRILEREQIALGRAVRPDQRKQPHGATTAADEVDEDTRIKMMGSIGERIELMTPLDEGRVTALTIHPKGLLAFIEMDALDQDCKWFAAHLLVLQQHVDDGVASAGDLQAAQLAAQRIVDLQARLVWIATSPGSRCPYDPVSDPFAAPPAYLLDLDPLDLTRILMGHRRVNGSRELSLKAFVPLGKASNTPATWSVFIAATAREIHEDPETLMRDWPLQKIVAAAAGAAKARLDAEKAAEEAAKQKGA